MITVRMTKHLAGSRTVSRVRSGRTINRAKHSVLLNQGRTVLGYARLLANDVHRKWRSGLWHLRR